VCGIAGLLGPVGGRSGEALEAAAQAMADRLSHRGPDGSGVWSDPAWGFALGHRRLAVGSSLTTASHTTPMRWLRLCRLDIGQP